MGTRKKGVELVFNLQWTNKRDSGGEKSNVIGMYDTVFTTSNFITFKSYLLKNSGVAGDDAKVTYLTDGGVEWDIDSQQGFEIALCAFRLKARLGEVIFLKLDKISNEKQAARKHSNDVETQSDVDSLGTVMAEPPEWFIDYMKQFKRDLVDEVTYKVAANFTPNTKENGKEKESIHSIPIVITTSKKHKPDITKRSRKHLVLGETPIDKELLRTFKYDRKLENKLDKLDAKTKKIKEKKQALISKIENDDQRPIEGNDQKTAPAVKNPPAVGVEKNQKDVATIIAEHIKKINENKPLLGATCHDSNSYERLMGGELFIRRWNVSNSGQQRWSRNTELRLTWGSSELIPSLKTVAVPPLVPGGSTTISLCFKVPKKPGTYETYWNFYDGNTRFGNSLSCCVIVDEPLAPINPFEFQEKTVKENFPMYRLFNEPDEARRSSDKSESTQPPQQSGYGLFTVQQVDDGLKPPTATESNIWRKEEPVEESPENAYRAECIIRKARAMKSKLFHTAGTFPKKKNIKALDIFSLSSDEECVPFLLRRSEREKLPEPYPKKERKRDVDEEKARPGIPCCYEMDKPELSRKPLSLHISREAHRDFLNIDHDLLKITPVPPTGIPFYGVFSPSQQSDDLSTVEEFPQQENKEPDFDNDESIDNADDVMDLSKRMEGIYFTRRKEICIEPGWVNLWDYDEKKQQMEFFPTNKYGIAEKDLVVDLSMNGKEVKPEDYDRIEDINAFDQLKAEEDKEEENANVNNNEDDNNNNGTSDNNNSGESFCEVDSEASSVSSGYDVLQIPVCEEKEEGSEPTGYVYITIDGNKLPVPKHILRPDFLSNAEEAPGPLNTDDEKSLEPQKKEAVVEEATIPETTEPEVSDEKLESVEQGESQELDCCKRQVNKEKQNCPLSDGGAGGVGRLFIFPQTQPGFEVVSDSNRQNENPEEVSEPEQNYNWKKSPTQYNHSEVPINPLYLRGDPYGPLDHTTEPYAPPTSEQQSHISMTPPSVSSPYGVFYPAISYHQSHQYPCCGNGCGYHPSSPHVYVPNYQQSVPKSKAKSPSAPPEPPKPTENASGHSVPMMLPENLMTGAVNVASSAINTARSVINMISQPKKEPGRWQNGHWVTEDQNSSRAKNLQVLAEMGFIDADLNATLLARYNDNLQRVVAELIELTS